MMLPINNVQTISSDEYNGHTPIDVFTNEEISDKWILMDTPVTVINGERRAATTYRVPIAYPCNSFDSIEVIRSIYKPFIIKHIENYQITHIFSIQLHIQMIGIRRVYSAYVRGLNANRTLVKYV